MNKKELGVILVRETVANPLAVSVAWTSEAQSGDRAERCEASPIFKINAWSTLTR
jgi:hypothetical protein